MTQTIEKPRSSARPARNASQAQAIPTLRCMAYPHNGKYVTECIDLDIVAIGDDSAQAKGKLAEAIGGYIEVAFEGDIRGLIPRPSPLRRRLLWRLLRIMAVVTTRRFSIFDCSSTVARAAYS